MANIFCAKPSPEAAHKQGIIHRGLKPANIKLRSDDVVKVSAICLAMGSTYATGIAPWAIRSASVGPSTNSMTNARTSTPSTSPSIAAMFG